jgi:NADH-quinone oxidoreductase subunit C
LPDATGLELAAQELREKLGDDVVVGTHYFRGQATLEVQPKRVHDVVALLLGEASEPYDLLMSVHANDYFPEEPRLAVHYQLLAMRRTDRLNVKVRMGVDEAELPSVCDLFPGAEYDEREVFDMFGVVFTGHPDLRRILLPEDYEGHPLRRDFPIGGEPVLYTFNEKQTPNWYE